MTDHLLIEADSSHPEDHLFKGEYRIKPPHVTVACPECGGSAKNVFYLSIFEEQKFHCRHCDWLGTVKLTGGRG